MTIRINSRGKITGLFFTHKIPALYIIPTEPARTRDRKKTSLIILMRILIKKTRIQVQNVAVGAQAMPQIKVNQYLLSIATLYPYFARVKITRFFDIQHL